MKKILFIQSSAKSQTSHSNKLGEEIVRQLKEKYQGSSVFIRNVAVNQIPHLTEEVVDSFHVPEENRSAKEKEIISLSDHLVEEFLSMDIIVIALPMYNHGIPSTLKTWIDHVARARKTFKYTPTGVVGLVEGKEIYLAISSGSVFSVPPKSYHDFTESYLRSVFELFGLKDVTTYRVEGLGIAHLKEGALENAKTAVQIHR